MFLTRCPFCTNTNPQGSRFCNACGSPLHLRPCPHCEAVNDVAAHACHRCGATLALARDAATPPIPAQRTRAAHAAELAELEVALARISVDERASVTPLPVAVGAALSTRGAGVHAPDEGDRDAPPRIEPRAATIVDDDGTAPVPAARRTAPRARASIAATLAVAAVVAIGAYAWRAQRASEAPAAAHADTVAPRAAPAADTPVTPPAANEEAPPATKAESEAPIASDRDSRPAPRPPTAETTRSPGESASPRMPAAAPKSKGASQDALATERVIRRALGGFTSTPPTPPH